MDDLKMIKKELEVLTELLETNSDIILEDVLEDLEEIEDLVCIAQNRLTRIHGEQK